MDFKEQFSQNVLKYSNSLFFVAKGVLKNDADAEDAVCNAIMKAYENFGQLKDIKAFKSWITRIVINEAYMICRKNKNTQSIEEILQEPSYIVKYYDDTWEIVNSLEEEYKTVLILFYYNDFSINEIAQTLDIAKGTVKSRLNRGRQKVKELIK